MFHEDANVFNTFVKPQGYMPCVLVRSTECKNNFCVFTKQAYTRNL